MCIKSILLTTALFQIVIPSGHPTNNPLQIIQHEYQQRFHTDIPLTNPHAIKNFQQEIITPKSHFSFEMPFLSALSIATSLDTQQIHQAMLPLINQYQGTAAGNILQKVFQPSHVAIPVSFEEAFDFSVLFALVFPGYVTDLYVVHQEQNPNVLLPILYKRCANPGKHVIKRIKLFSQINGLWRAIIPNTFDPQQIPQQSPIQHGIVQTQTQTQTRSQKSRSRYPSKRDAYSPSNIEGGKSDNQGKTGQPDPDKKVSSTNVPKKQSPQKNTKGSRDGGSRRGAKGAKSDKADKGSVGGSVKKNSRKKWIIGCIIAVLVIIPFAGCGIYFALNTKRSEPSNQAQSGQRSGDSNV